MNSVNKEDNEMLSLLGERHDAKAKALGLPCPCNLCKSNDKVNNARGQRYRIMVADAKECSEGVSFFGVRRFLIVDVPNSASEYIQRVGRAIRFMGHAGLPKEERKVRIRLYQATLPRDAVYDDGVQQQLKTRDEELVEQLKSSVAAYQRKLRALQQEAFDNGTWNEAAEDVMEDIDLDTMWDEEVEEVVWDEEAPPAPAPVPVPPLAPPPAPGASSFATSRYKKLYEAAKGEEYSVATIWDAVQAIVATCSATEMATKLVAEMVAQRFVKRLKMTYITAGKKYADETDADKLAVLLWSSTELSTDTREFCSYLNESLRADKDPPLRSAVVRARPCHRLWPVAVTLAV